MNEKWEFCLRLDKGDQRLFRLRDTFEFYICDNSGANPDCCDDGPLELNVDKIVNEGLFASNTTGSGIWVHLPLRKERDNRRECNCSTTLLGGMRLLEYLQVSLSTLDIPRQILLKERNKLAPGHTRDTPVLETFVIQERGGKSLLPGIVPQNLLANANVADIVASIDLKALAALVAPLLVDGDKLTYSDLAEHIDLRALSEHVVQRIIERGSGGN